MILKSSESDIQITYFDWVKWMAQSDERFTYITKMPNEGKRTPWYGKRMKDEGLSKGYPDIIIDWPIGRYHGARIEVKSLGGKLTTEQREWVIRLAKAGYKVSICFSVEDLISFTNYYFGLSEEKLVVGNSAIKIKRDEDKIVSIFKTV